MVRNRIQFYIIPHKYTKLDKTFCNTIRNYYKTEKYKTVHTFTKLYTLVETNMFITLQKIYTTLQYLQHFCCLQNCLLLFKTRLFDFLQKGYNKSLQQQKHVATNIFNLVHNCTKLYVQNFSELCEKNFLQKNLHKLFNTLQNSIQFYNTLQHFTRLYIF
jgi:hypothetical protein